MAEFNKDFKDSEYRKDNHPEVKDDLRPFRKKARNYAISLVKPENAKNKNEFTELQLRIEGIEKAYLEGCQRAILEGLTFSSEAELQKSAQAASRYFPASYKYENEEKNGFIEGYKEYQKTIKSIK